MIATINGLPVYDALMQDEATGMIRISLVDDPAVMSLWQSFDNRPKMMKYAVTNEERRLVRGVVMRADFPIYRADEMGEYYIMYKPETIRKMAEKYLAENRQNLVNLMHEDGTEVEGVQMVQYFIKGDGVSVEGFDDIADGSLFAEFHVTNDAVWEAIKAGTYKGFSLEGVFNVAPDTNGDEVAEIADALEGLFSNISKRLDKINMSKVTRLKAAIAKLLSMEFGNVTTDKGILLWDGEDDLKEGDDVRIEDADGNAAPAPDGDYTTEDGKVIVVVDGKVAEIKDAEAEVAPEDPETPEVEEEPAEEVDAEETEEAPAQEEAPAPAEDSDRVAELEAEIAALQEENAAVKAENEALRAELDALKGEAEELRKMSAAKPAHEEMQDTAAIVKTGNKRLDNLARLMGAK